MDEDFDLLCVGVEGKTEAVPKQIPPKDGCSLPRSTVPFGLPPVLPSLEEELDSLLDKIDDLPIHDYRRTQKFLPRECCPENLYSLGVTPLQTTLVVDRNPTTGELLGFREEYLPDTGATSQSSTSLLRPPAPPGNDIKGNSINVPFWPGGLDDPDISNLKSKTRGEDIDFDNDLLTTPPGFKNGMTFSSKPLLSVLDLGEKPSLLNLADIMAQGDLYDLGDEEDEQEEGVKNKPQEEHVEPQPIPEEDAAQRQTFDEIVQLDERVECPGDLAQSGSSATEEWSVKVDINSPVNDFYKRIPDMAFKWPFEPDTFQKQAILHLEKHDNVFVAAHTSAGKTVVAEYAIALSLKHMTRSIYTSPIKALSNQKFRDFKQTFGDVGLVTGDVQINSQAACLIMTTEILRSMLYNGSDVVRDLEWVIFDEVHYINDSERGVVWEEVLIMLPQHVHIILLSATVPNTMEFAGWVGRTKKKKVYVVSTSKRPVPLEHFLYTGNSNKTSNELFLILDANKNFLTQGYNKALEAKSERSSKSGSGQGGRGQRSGGGGGGGGGPQQDKNVWLSVIEMLRKKDKLPVVAFTFSKKRINDNAHYLSSVDLLTASEKSVVHIFFHKCISQLKGSDKDLPQVKQMEDTLKRGIGIHHSGILPILKEVVEMLFQKGVVKILFATETFAMGVNMPARTVVFDSVRKHDGTCLRDLLPGEYIQMAGRAGRRGLDTTGTVIILCKAGVPEMAELHKMMLGKPTLLQSQFRLTYTMILNLLRVEQLRVEDMMKRSFSEFHNQKDVSQRRSALEGLVEKIKDMPEIVDYTGDLEQYYRACDEYWGLHTRLHEVAMSHPQSIKSLSPGRLIIVDNPKYKYTLGVILQTAPSTSKERTFLALVICEQKQQQNYENLFAANNSVKSEDKSADSESEEHDWLLPKPFLPSELFRPEGPCDHEMVSLKVEDIAVITTKTIKISADKIVDDIKKRKQARFRKDPPSQSVSTAAQELLRLTEANPNGFPGLDPVKDLHIRDVELVEDFRRMTMLQDKFQYYSCVHSPTFEENFKQLRSNIKLQEKYNNLRFLLSDESLTLLPEYQQRIEVLRQLQYVDDCKTVQLKGRVACEISSHELIITELVFENILTELHPSEIAAVLSSVVFEQKRCSEPNLSPTLEKAKEDFLTVAERIGTLQKDCGLLMPVGDYVDQFNFGLTEVVFEWARGMPFSEITNLTDVQEGIIVRCIQRLDETIRDVRGAARIIGDPKLHQKMEEASSLIKRDIVFAASLYTT